MVKCDWCKNPEHIELLTELCEHDPETQRQQTLIAQFFKVYPRILGLSYDAADVLRREKNLKIRHDAIDSVAEEIEKRPKPGSDGYSITRRRVTADKVREILNETRITVDGTHLQREKLLKKQAQKEIEDKEAIYTCPFFLALPEDEKTKYECHGSLLIKSIKRDKIVSLRVTVDADDAFAYLAKEFDIPRSKILSVFLGMRPKFPNMFKD